MCHSRRCDDTGRRSWERSNEEAKSGQQKSVSKNTCAVLDSLRCVVRGCADKLASFLCQSVSSSLCEQIAAVRRKVQRSGVGHVVFLDETLKREGDVDSYSIFLPGQLPLIETSATSKYAARYDMIAACTGKEVLLPSIYAPTERGAGITTSILIRFIDNILAQQLRALDRYPLILLLDRASIHNEEQIMEALRDRGCGEVTNIIKLPPASAKRLSPLDNSLFNLWRQRVLADGPLNKKNIRQRMSDAWNSITAAELLAQYRNCGLLRDQDPYFDCPDPATHQHGSYENGCASHLHPTFVSTCPSS